MHACFFFLLLVLHRYLEYFDSGGAKEGESCLVRQSHTVKEMFVLRSLHVEADGGNCGHHLAELQIVQNGGLARSIQPTMRIRISFLPNGPANNFASAPPIV